MELNTAEFSPDITPLIAAAHRNNYEILKILLDRGATILTPHGIKYTTKNDILLTCFTLKWCLFQMLLWRLHQRIRGWFVAIFSFASESISRISQPITYRFVIQWSAFDRLPDFMGDEEFGNCRTSTLLHEDIIKNMNTHFTLRGTSPEFCRVGVGRRASTSHFFNRRGTSNII